MNAAHGIQSVAWLLVALPALSAAALLLLGKRADRWGHLLGALVPVVLFVYAVLLFFSIKAEGGEGRERNLHLFSWVPVGGFNVDAGFLLDPLSLTFVLLITGVGSLIHIYAVGYMDHDPGRRRFFGYFHLFIAAMLLLVLANGYLVLYVGWEGVGLASYLLIGYYYTRESAGTAAKKAFVANRVGDVGLSIAIMLMFAYLGSTDFETVFAGVNGLSSGVITAIALMLLLGACGKSGQFPLQTWLPDAMEGPTPVSALIHAATECHELDAPARGKTCSPHDWMPRLAERRARLMTPTYYLVLSAALFSIGAVGVLVRRNAIVVFMCVELMLNAVNLSLVTFSRINGTLDGQIMAFFVMVVAAAEVVVGLAIIMSIFRTRRSASVDDANLLKY